MPRGTHVVESFFGGTEKFSFNKMFLEGTKKSSLDCGIENGVHKIVLLRNENLKTVQ